MNFCKIYNTDVGQILVLRKSDESGKPEIKIYFEPETLGVCSITIGFPDTGKGWDKHEAAFNEIDENSALHTVESLIKELGEEV